MSRLPDQRQAEWMRMVRGICAVLFLLLVTRAVPGFAWGPTGHRIVNSNAVDTLPPEIRLFSKPIANS
jgi:hypothetical protein